MLDDPAPDALEALTEFLYLVPVGLMQFHMDGRVMLANPLAAQFLMPLAPAGDLSDAYSALAPLVPDLARLVHGSTDRTGVILDHRRCEAAGGVVLSVTLHRLHGATMLLVLDDVTRLVEQERRIQADQQRFRAIFDNVRDYAIYTLDAEGCVDGWNPSLQRFGGWQPEDVERRPIEVFFPPEDRAPERMAGMLAEARRTGSLEMEGWRRRRDGSRIWANSVLTALPDEAGGVRGFVAVSRDMTERKRMEDELRRLATTDPLTGASNRRAGQAALAEIFAGPDGAAVLMLDIDHFKSINDRHGHKAGDEALCSLVATCRAVLPAGTPVIRWGGEEFLIVLPGAADAAAMAETLRAAIAATEVTLAEGALCMTASLGVATGGDRSPEALLQRADAALYAAKRGGRNRVEQAPVQAG
ncbi:diguanylate cyclase domain-containing protein [Falsiroseomonas sp. HC035]|uniref:sensor domain-containing diguanylate cyclase n=1 Tax=Falsiroseomonas sp. HC035 TaxID=3390999 RepID=UPI003D31893B